MNVTELAAEGLSTVWKAEIEKAVDNVKRSAWDKWGRKPKRRYAKKGSEVTANGSHP